jgi:hypothetical protein
VAVNGPQSEPMHILSINGGGIAEVTNTFPLDYGGEL